MKNRLLFVFASLVLMAGFLIQCTPQQTQGGPNSPCQTTGDCSGELQCRVGRCLPPIDNKAPIAKFVIDPNPAKAGDVVTLDGSGSIDPEGEDLLYKWELQGPKGSKAELKGKDSKSPTFTPDLPGTYVIKLVVNDGKLDSKPAGPIELKVEDSDNQAPVANAGPDQNVAPGAKVTLDGTSSYDPDNSGELSYRWTLNSAPKGSKAKLDNPETAKPKFTADLDGRYIFALRVIDGRNKESSIEDTVTILARKGYDKTPTLSSITPTTASAETVVNMEIKGKDFVSGAKVILGTKRFETTFVDATFIKARIDLRGVSAQEYDLKVANINEVPSNGLKFVVKGIPIPKITKLDPDYAAAGAKLEFKVIGEGFVSASVVNFNTTPLETKFVNDKELIAKLNLKTAPTGTYKISVTNPGNRRSNEKDFEVQTPGPPPTLNVLNPPRALVGKKISFSVHGTGFDKNAVIYFNDKPIPSKRVRRDEVQADPSLDLTKMPVGDYLVYVKNGDGQVSKKLTFSVEDLNPTPKLDRILPFSVFLDEESTLFVYGQRFRKGIKLFIGKTEVTNVNFRSESYLEAKVDTTKGSWTAGNYDAYVENPGKKKSNVFKVTVTYRQPSINAITPSGWSTLCGTTVEITGINFVKRSKVYFGSTLYTTTSTSNKLTYVSDKKLSFTIPKNTSAGTYKIYVDNGPNAASAKSDFVVRNSKSETPLVREIRPSSGQADTKVAFQAYYTSSSGYFRPGAYLELNGKRQETTCSLSFDKSYCYNLSGNFDLSGMKPGSYKVYVVNPCNARSAPLTFLVTDPPAPAITGFKPGYVTVGSQSNISITGQNIAKGMQVIWGGKTIKATFKSPTEILTDKLDFSTATAGEVKVQVDNKNGKKTNEVRFSILPAKHPLTISAISQTKFERSKSYSNVTLSGSGFTAKSKLYFDGKTVAFNYKGASSIEIPSFNLSSVKPGNYEFYVEDAGKKSNIFTIYVSPLPAPQIRYLSPSTLQVGKSSSLYLYIWGNNICPGSRGRCSKTPKVVIKDSAGKDWSSRFTVSYSYNTYIRGQFNVNALTADGYKFTLELPTGESSNVSIFSLTPPPPPVLNSLSPPFAYRGNPLKQQLSLTGSNFATGDLVIFNNKTLNRIPGTVQNGGKSLLVSIDVTQVRYAGKYPVYVIRCKDSGCTKFDKTAVLNWELRDPPCTGAFGVNCSTDISPKNSEVCVTAAGVCRPKCTTNADCTKLGGAPSTAKCVSGACQ